MRLPARPEVSVVLQDLGRPRLLVDGQEVRPRIAKSYELLAYLSTRPKGRAERDQLLDALFDGRNDPSTRAYLRQATTHCVIACRTRRT